MTAAVTVKVTVTVTSDSDSGSDSPCHVCVYMHPCLHVYACSCISEMNESMNRNEMASIELN